MGLIDGFRKLFRVGSNDASENSEVVDGVSINVHQDDDVSSEIPVDNPPTRTPLVSGTRGNSAELGMQPAPRHAPLGTGQPISAHRESPSQSPASLPAPLQMKDAKKEDQSSEDAIQAKTPDSENPSSMPNAPKAPSLNLPKEQPMPKEQQSAEGNLNKSKAKESKPHKKVGAKPKRAIRRPPDEYYPDAVTLNCITMSADEYSKVSGIEKIKPARVSATLDKGGVKLVAGKISLGNVIGLARSELMVLLEAGYSVRVANIKVEESRELTYRSFDKDYGMSWEEYETTYDVRVTLELLKPQKLMGEAIVVPNIASAKGNVRKRTQVRSVVAAKCRSQTLHPNEGIAVELTALGCSKPEIAQAMGWTAADTAEHLKSAYRKLNVRSKTELDKLIKVLSGEGDEEEVFRFTIAGTRYHQKEAKGLLKAKAADLCAVREPNNTHDRNAIRIELTGGLVGYVPKRLARDIAKLIDAGYKPVFTELNASTRYDTEYYWDEWDIRRERETKRKIVDAKVTLVCKNPYVEKKADFRTDDMNNNGAGNSVEKQLDGAEISKGVAKLRKRYSLNQNEVAVIERIASGLTRNAIAKDLGWSINKAKDNAKSAYRKLGIHSKDELCGLIESEVATKKSSSKTDGRSGKIQAKTKQSAPKQESGISYVGVGDFIVRVHRYSTSHKGHTMDPVEAKVNVLVAGKYLREKEFRAFYCRQCNKYFVTDTAYEKLRRLGTLCCRVVEFDDVFNSTKNRGFASDFAAESTIHQYGYNVNKDEDLSSGERQAILSFLIENEVMKTYEIVSFIEGLISLRISNPNMADAISKWKADVSFLEHYHPPKQSLKVGTLYAKKR